MERKTEGLLFRWLQPQHHLILMLVMAACSFLFGYSISVGAHLIAPFPQTISNTGTVPPASCVFSLFLSISSTFGVIFMYIRHGHLEIKLLNNDRGHKVNDVSFFIGLASCFGILMVASFQVTEQWPMHMTGAATAFIMGCLYCWMQSYLSYIMDGVVKKKLILRLMLALCGTLGLIGFFTLTQLAKSDSKSKYDLLHWKKSIPGFYLRVACTVAEWACAFSVLGFFSTFYNEFKCVDFKLHIHHKEAKTTVNETSYRT